METEQQSEFQDQDQQQFTQPSSSEVTLVPFVKQDDAWIASDEFLASLYQRTQDQGLVKTVFWEGGVHDHQGFIEMAKRKRTAMVFVFRGNNCAGYAWLAPIVSNYALPHFCFFKDYWGDTSKELAETVIDYCFSFPTLDGEDRLFDVLVGIIPDFNVRAHRFVESIGAKKVGVIPKMFRNKLERVPLRDAHVYYWAPNRD